MNRRDFFNRTTAVTVGLATIPGILSATMGPGSKKQKGIITTLKPGDVILFQGDSITDAGREREKQLPNFAGSFGSGYALLAASALLNSTPEKGFQIFNRGVGGNKVYQLSDRWQKDCFDLRPQVLSILVGVNDYWHTLSGKYDGTIEKYESDYRQLLSLTKKMLPDVHLVIGEPFAVLGCSAVDEKWFPKFDSYREIAKKLAAEFGAVFIPYQSIFNEALNYAPGKYWTPDGVHPSMAGASLMAEAWLKAVR